MYSVPRPETREAQDQALAQASAAAAVGDAHNMVVALCGSGVLDGITRGIRAKWPRLSHDHVDDAVATAVVALFVAVHSGRKVLDVGAYLWKAANNQAHNAYTLYQTEQSRDPGLPLVSPVVARNDEDVRDRLRAEAVAVARMLLPRLGQANVCAVMEYVIDAVESGDIHVSNQEIGDALGLAPHTVRTLLSRGFQRLQRIVQSAGLVSLEEELATIGRERADEDDDDEGDDELYTDRG